MMKKWKHKRRNVLNPSPFPLHTNTVHVWHFHLAADFQLNFWIGVNITVEPFHPFSQVNGYSFAAINLQFFPLKRSVSPKKVTKMLWKCLSYRGCFINPNVLTECYPYSNGTHMYYNKFVTFSTAKINFSPVFTLWIPSFFYFVFLICLPKKFFREQLSLIFIFSEKIWKKCH